jgi:hypothetical protein
MHEERWDNVIIAFFAMVTALASTYAAYRSRENSKQIATNTQISTVAAQAAVTTSRQTNGIIGEMLVAVRRQIEAEQREKEARDEMEQGPRSKHSMPGLPDPPADLPSTR